MGEAATALLTGCILGGSANGWGLWVGTDTSVIAINCNLSDCHKGNVYVYQGGHAVLSSCKVCGSKEGAGMRAWHKGSLVLAERCSVESNKAGGVKEEYAGKVVQY